MDQDGTKVSEDGLLGYDGVQLRQPRLDLVQPVRWQPEAPDVEARCQVPEALHP